VTTRCQPDQDLILIPRAAGGQLDPSAPAPFVSALVGIDATRPFGLPFAEVPTIPGVERVPDLATLISRGEATRTLAAS
jgi:4-hydroxy-3-polyprenylbenzoate decarboxylase/2,5-furandicarboxylate decarboxylase 1